MNAGLLAFLCPIAGLAGCATPALSAPSPHGEPVVVQIDLSTKGDDIAFDKTSIQLVAGRRYRIRFRNLASPDSMIAHNVVVLRPGSEDRVIAKLQAVGYDLASLADDPDIIARSNTLNPGEHGEVAFAPVEAGIYPYLCSMPGHGDILGMKGLVNVVAGAVP